MSTGLEIRNRLPSARFNLMHDELNAVRIKLANDQYYDEEGYWIDVCTIAEKLDGFSIPRPTPISGRHANQEKWAKFLAWMVKCSSASDLKGARLVAREHNFL